MRESRIVVRPNTSKPEILGLQLPNPFDLESFGWGAAAGALVGTAATGAVMWYAYPYIKAFVEAVPLFRQLADIYKGLTG